MPSLEVLKVNNCGLGPEGGEMIAAALSRNEGLKLKHFEAGRDRLENKGITALANVFAQMNSLEVVHVPQNGIKDEGMSILLFNLGQSCPGLNTLNINDNLLMSLSIKNLLKVCIKCPKLTHLNISDLNMGQEAVIATFQALEQAQNTLLYDLSCNYNEVNSGQAARLCFQLMEKLANKTCDEDGDRKLKKIEFIGCGGMPKAELRQFQVEFNDNGVQLVLFEEGEDDEDDDDDDFEEEEEDSFNKDQLDELSSKITQILAGGELD